VYLLKRSLAPLLSLTVLLSVGCSAQAPSQTAKPAPLNNQEVSRLKRIIRSHFEVDPEVDIALGMRTPSDFAGYDALPVTLSKGEKSQNFDFLLSTDGTKLLRKLPAEEPTDWKPSSGVGTTSGNEIDITSTYRFLVSKDGRKLMRMSVIEDPMEKISLAGRPVRGNNDAKVTIVVYDDFECPYCRANHEELFGDLFKEYGDKVRIIYKDFPLFEIHPWAGHAAVDANCLAAQSGDAFWDFADYVHPHAKEITGEKRDLAAQTAALDKLATDIGQRRNLNASQLQACLKAQDESAIRASVKEGDSLGVNATPTMFINGEKTEGIVSPESLRAMLDSDLRDAGQTPPVHTGQAQSAQENKAAPASTKP
jgi:protein-disulfide isomerase